MLSAKHSELLTSVVINACSQAEQILERYDSDAPAFEQLMQNLELSPLLEKQFIAVGLRIAKDLCLSAGIRTSMLNRFRSPPPGVAVEAQRRAIEREVKERGLPMELAGDYADTLQRRIVADEQELPDLLWGYAAIYDLLWSDPRIGAGTPTRRIMLAMATVLRGRSAQLATTKSRNPQSSKGEAATHPEIQLAR
ncbi:hypothetical protein [Novosphingobium sp. JCM 18896]|uniref:hypothetical protein n=1 Tax=Novosphingobium sp. JCM 18896 TaxID=2989731 RepID=UPI002221D532|nr:hypothetical protein [Novosphingobium sp. JCM 18896]MCW1432465.1 hypothetical protein [Novosphingobium sp. JCM 18896]